MKFSIKQLFCWTTLSAFLLFVAFELGAIGVAVMLIPLILCVLIDYWVIHKDRD